MDAGCLLRCRTSAPPTCPPCVFFSYIFYHRHTPSTIHFLYPSSLPASPSSLSLDFHAVEIFITSPCNEKKKMSTDSAIRQTWVQIPASSLISCVSLEKSLNLSETPFLLPWGEDTITWLMLAFVHMRQNDIGKIFPVGPAHSGPSIKISPL